MYASRSAKFAGWQQEFNKGADLRNPLNRYEQVGDSQAGRLGSAVFNPFDGVTFGSVPTSPIEQAQKEVAEAGAAIGQASGKIAFNPGEGHKELIAAQARLATATAKLESLMLKQAQAQKKSTGGMPKEVLLVLLVLAAAGGYFFYRKQGGR